MPTKLPRHPTLPSLPSIGSLRRRYEGGAPGPIIPPEPPGEGAESLLLQGYQKTDVTLASEQEIITQGYTD